MLDKTISMFLIFFQSSESGPVYCVRSRMFVSAFAIFLKFLRSNVVGEKIQFCDPPSVNFHDVYLQKSYILRFNHQID